jgi:protein TonB
MENRRTNPVIWALQRLAALVIAVGTTLSIFLFLPVMQMIGATDKGDLIVRDLGSVNLPPPPPPPPEEQIEEEEVEEEQPELAEEVAPLDLSQLELALNAGFGEGAIGDFTVQLVNQLTSGGGEGDDLDQIFSLADLDQRPRVIFQRVPSYPPELRRANRQGTVYVTFTVDVRGRVVNPKVEQSTDPAFERPALEAVRQWRFEPGTRNGQKVQFKMRIPITFNAA